MNQNDVKEILLKAFSVLDDDEASNFEFHLQRETPVLSEENWDLFTDGRGGG